MAKAFFRSAAAWTSMICALSAASTAHGSSGVGWSGAPTHDGIRGVARDDAARPKGAAAMGTDDVALGIDLGPFSSCEELMDRAQVDVFAKFEFVPAHSVADDPECSENVLFQFAAELRRRARGAGDLAARARVSDEDPVDADFQFELSDPDLAYVSVEDDLLRALVAKVRDGLYGSAVRNLGHFNEALSCSSENSVRILDLLLAEILLATVDSDLPLAEKKECVQGVFNAALNTFDQLQHTRKSLVQYVMYRRFDAIRSVLVPGYPVCTLGVLVYDFATGRLERLIDPQACVPPVATTKGSKAAKPKKSGIGAVKNIPNPSRYLDGYLAAFKDPRFFGHGKCSLQRMAGSDMNFKCSAGIECSDRPLPIENARDPRTVSDRLSRGGVQQPAGDPFGRRNSPFGGAPQQRQGERWFGLEPGVASAFLCQGAGTPKGSPEGSFGLPPGHQDTTDPQKNFMNCQTATLFTAQQDPVTSCMVNAIEELRNLEQQAQDDPGIGMGARDPHCNVSWSKYWSRPRDPERVHEAGKDQYGNRDNTAYGDLERSGFQTARSWADSRLAGYDMIEWAAGKGLMGEGLEAAIDAALATPVYLVEDLAGVDSALGLTVASEDSPTGQAILLDADLVREDPVRAGVVLLHERGHAALNAMGLPCPAGDGGKYHHDQYLEGEGNLEDAAQGWEAGESDEADPLPDDEDPLPAEEPEEDGSASDDFFGDGAANACTNALGRARNAVLECQDPSNSAQMQYKRGVNGRAPSQVDPKRINPAPDAAPVTYGAIAGIVACVEQFGRDIQKLNGSNYGPNARCEVPEWRCGDNGCEYTPSDCAGGPYRRGACTYMDCSGDLACGCFDAWGQPEGATSNRCLETITCADGQVPTMQQGLCVCAVNTDGALPRQPEGDSFGGGRPGSGGDPKDRQRP